MNGAAKMKKERKNVKWLFVLLSLLAHSAHFLFLPMAAT